MANAFRGAKLLRPMRVDRYDPGQELTYHVTSVWPERTAQVRLHVENFVGGGFAGQVYRVRVLHIDADGEELGGLVTGNLYAMKILVPPSHRARRFRDAIYRMGFQGAFSLQVNPSAARAGALWQTFIRQAAAARFGTERAVAGVHATFVDEAIGSCGELSEWVDGRVWRLEVNDRLGALRRWKRGRADDGRDPGSPEYRAKREFMAAFVKLLHDVGAPELARQYEWGTCKSQPNVLKRLDAGDNPSAGLTAVDFRAGLALMAVLPMSPGDFRLIFKGLCRGSLVQFDRGTLRQLKQFIDASPDTFAGMDGAYERLVELERTYRDSLIDVTHHGPRLLKSLRLWRGLCDGAVTGWRTSGKIDDGCADVLGRSRMLTGAYALLRALPKLSVLTAIVLLCVLRSRGDLTWAWGAVIAALALIAPPLLKLARRLIGRGDFRRHTLKLLSSPEYIRRTLKARAAEKLIAWHRSGRVGPERAIALSRSGLRFFLHVLISFLPARLHRFVTDAAYAKAAMHRVFVQPIRLWLNPNVREQWLREALKDGHRRHIISEEDAAEAATHISDPYIQKYLIAMSITFATFPVTRLVAIAMAVIHAQMNPHLSSQEAWVWGGGIFVLLHVLPISPGSIVRALYVWYLVLRERNFKDYNIAATLACLKFVGYFGFPIQMAYRYPALARFIAVYWATGIVRKIPVFGEHGALLERGVFDLCYNWPLTIRRRHRLRTKLQAALTPRRWHVLPILLAGWAMLLGIHAAWFQWMPTDPTFDRLWPIVLLVPVVPAIPITALARGARSGRRLIIATLYAAILGLVYPVTAACYASIAAPQSELAGMLGDTSAMLQAAFWRGLLFAILGASASATTELATPEPVRGNVR